MAKWCPPQTLNIVTQDVHGRIEEWYVNYIELTLCYQQSCSTSMYLG